jgi:hypothetical protein
MADTQVGAVPQTFKYLALYEIETDDASDFFRELISRTGTDRLPVSTALAGGAVAVLWREL